MFRFASKYDRHPAMSCILICGIVAGSMSGCGTIKFASYPDRPVESMEYSVTQSRVSIGIDPLTTREEAMKYFKVDLQHKDILAVYVKLRNESSSSVLFENAQCTLVNFKSVIGRESLQSNGLGSTVAIAGAVLLSLPLLFIGAKMLSDSDHIKQNFVVSEFRRQGVSPGETAAGFIYFQYPRAKSGNSDTLLLLVKPTRLDGSPIGTFEFTIDSKGQ